MENKTWNLSDVEPSKVEEAENALTIFTQLVGYKQIADQIHSTIQHSQHLDTLQALTIINNILSDQNGLVWPEGFEALLLGRIAEDYKWINLCVEVPWYNEEEEGGALFFFYILGDNVQVHGNIISWQYTDSEGVIRDRSKKYPKGSKFSDCEYFEQLPDLNPKENLDV